MTVGVLDVSDVEATGVLLNVLQNTDSTDVVSTSHDNLRAVFKLNQAFDLSGLKVQLHKQGY